MALAGVLGLNSRDNFGRKTEPEDPLDVESFSGNIHNNLQLALPPFANVSFVLKNAKTTARLYALSFRSDS